VAVDEKNSIADQYVYIFSATEVPENWTTLDFLGGAAKVRFLSFSARSTRKTNVSNFRNIELRRRS